MLDTNGLKRKELAGLQEGFSMIAVIVAFELVPGKANEFMPLMQRQAKNSRSLEAGCVQFDICFDSSSPDNIFLYEVYEDRAAFEAHLASDHFKEFVAATGDMVSAKMEQIMDNVHRF